MHDDVFLTACGCIWTHLQGKFQFPYEAGNVTNPCIRIQYVAKCKGSQHNQRQSMHLPWKPKDLALAQCMHACMQYTDNVEVSLQLQLVLLRLCVVHA